MQKTSCSPPIAALLAVLKRRACPIVWLLSLGLLFTGQPIHAATLPNAEARRNSAWALALSNPAELMQETVQNELSNSYGHRAPLRYRLRIVNAKSDTTKVIVETSDGGVARLIAVNGRPLSTLQEQQEIERLHALDADPAVEAHRHRKETQDAQRIEKFTRLLPDAFVYQAADPVETPRGAIIRLAFAPNPKFSPPDFESRILTGIRGEVWIDSQDLRVVRIQGHTSKAVDFGWGIIGTLYPGATMRIEQSKTDACGWQMTHLSLHLLGKELMFKSLHVVVEETADDYHPVPRGWNYMDAVRWLLQTGTTPSPETNGP